MLVTTDYYTNEYNGLELDDTTLTRLLIRAENDINRLTMRILDLDDFNAANQVFIKNAICSQVEFLATQGETASVVGNEAGSFSIGSYSESKGGRYGATADANASRYADAVYDWLFPTGLLYAGVDALW